jgi:hypothetical protein
MSNMTESSDTKSSIEQIRPPFASDATIQPGPPKKPSFATQVVRDEDECQKARPQFTREDREKASKKSSKDYIHIAKEARAGLGTDLSMIDYAKIGMDSKDDSLFKNNLEVETFIVNFELHCIRYDMVEFYENFPVLDPPDSNGDDANRYSKGNTINLFKKWDRIGDLKDISLNQIADTIAWIKKYATKDSESYLEDLDWSHHSLIASMDDELQETVTSTLQHQFHPREKGGPLTFAVMIDKCINLSEEAIESLKKSVEAYDIKNIKGEDVSIVCRRFLYALKRLRSNDAITPSLIKSLFKVFQTTSVPEFNEFVAHWGRDLSRKGAVKPDFMEILTEVEDFYKRLLLSGEWCGTKTPQDEAAFIGERSQDHSGQQDNRGAQKSLFHRPTEDDRIRGSCPPRYVREIKGKKMKWCDLCSVKSRFTGKTRLGRWNTTHFTDEHTGKPASKEGQEQGANLIEKGKSFKDALNDAQSSE